MKQIVHVKNLHLGHVAKSFAMREDPTSIGKANMKGMWCVCVNRNIGKSNMKGVRRRCLDVFWLYVLG